MSSKLVRKGLDLVNNEEGSRSKKRKSTQKEKHPSKKRKQASKPNSEQRPRGFQDLRLSSGQVKKTQQADFTEQNLEYFKKATWKIKKDTYDKILERKNKHQGYKNVEEKHDESETDETGGLFDD